jgi:hypothetical protein
MPHLEVKVGPDYKHMEPCRVNDTNRPHEIDTEHFVGRVVVRIVDAPGAREGEDGREYFRGETSSWARKKGFQEAECSPSPMPITAYSGSYRPLS